MTNRDDRVRELAYFLWLEEGCPEGEAERHWLAAETLVESEPLEGEPLEGKQGKRVEGGPATSPTGGPAARASTRRSPPER